MISKRVVARNMVWNWAGMAVPMLAGFVVAPLLIAELGQTRYGLWILILALTGYFNLLDLGVCASVGRTLAFHRAREEREQVNATLSTAFTLLCGVGAVVLLATVGAALLFFHLFEVPPAEEAAVRLALFVVGFSLAVTFPLNVFDATLWAIQRFDAINKIDIPVVLLRTGLTFGVVLSGSGLVALALISVLTTLLAGALKALCCFRLERGLRLRVGAVHREAARGLFGYGVWAFLIAAARIVTERVGPFVIGARLAVQLVTPQSIAAKLTGYANGLMVAGAEVVTPVATRLHAVASHERQRRLFLEGGKYCLTLALFFLVFFLLLGRPFLGLWVGPQLEAAHVLLVILAAGELLPLSQQVTNSVVLGMSRHRAMALLWLAETAAAITLAITLAGPYGLVGVCLGLAIPAALFRGLGQLLYACRLLGVPLWLYLTRSMAPALASAVLPALCLALLVRWRVPASWLSFAGYTALYGLCFAATAGVMLLGWTQTTRRGMKLLRAVLGERKSPAPTPAPTASDPS